MMHCVKMRSLCTFFVSASDETAGEINEVAILIIPRMLPIALDENPSDTCKEVINLLAIEKWKLNIPQNAFSHTRLCIPPCVRLKKVRKEELEYNHERE